MPDFWGDVFSFSLDLFRVVAPRLTKWEVVQPVLPCWRLWWNSNPGGFVTWQGSTTAITPDKFVLVAPETDFSVKLQAPIERHLFIHFRLTADRLRLTDRVLAIPASASLRRQASEIVRQMPPEFIGMSNSLRGSSLVCSLLARIDQGFLTAPVGDPRIARALTMVDAALSRPWTNAEIARAVAMSTGGFVRLFRQAVGVAPQQYLQQQRLTLARNLLLQSSLSIDQIAERCGFCDRSYFSAVFRRGVGMPPARFRRNNCGESMRSVAGS